MKLSRKDNSGAAAVMLQRLVAVARRDTQAGAAALVCYCERPEAADRMEAALGACSAGVALQVVMSLDGVEWRPAGLRALRRLWAGSTRILMLAPLEAPIEAEALRMLAADVSAGRFESTADFSFLGHVTNNSQACEHAAPLVVDAVYDGGLASLLALIEWTRHLPSECTSIVADALLPPMERRRDAEQTLHAWLWLRGAALDDARLQPTLRFAQLRTWLQDAVRMCSLLSSGRHAQDGLLACVADLHDGAADNLTPLIKTASAAPDDYCAYALLDAIHRQLHRHQQLHTFQALHLFSAVQTATLASSGVDDSRLLLRRLASEAPKWVALLLVPRRCRLLGMRGADPLCFAAAPEVHTCQVHARNHLWHLEVDVRTALLSVSTPQRLLGLDGDRLVAIGAARSWMVQATPDQQFLKLFLSQDQFLTAGDLSDADATLRRVYLRKELDSDLQLWQMKVDDESELP